MAELPIEESHEEDEREGKGSYRTRNRLFWTMNRMVEELNPKIQGWRNYYAVDAFADLFLNKVDWYIRKRLMLFWNKKCNRRMKHSNSRLAGIVALQSGP
ncbi:hypothetical protein GCM10008018_07830 [Paenibacillus marchantiophytorum]|uniref:Group II intron maturase-specific domain-containing protein n=2 Tax=Paenibacillus marchantiophytorum TaxID=1619310 RepID=A0ABQ2BQY9_9BACL|nr:hypothetical protein GCM10008018_07830 [Paenibacillus marchantiophytorum]